MKFVDIVGDLQHYSRRALDGAVPAIYVADPWAPGSLATVECTGGIAGVPTGRKPILFYLTTVKAALGFFGADYDILLADGDVEAMCRKLAQHILAMNAQRERHDVDIEPINAKELAAEFSKVGPGRASSTKGFTVVFNPPGTVEYVDTAGVTRVETEPLLKPFRFAIYRRSRSLTELPDRRADEIVINIVRAMAFLGRQTEIL